MCVCVFKCPKRIAVFKMFSHETMETLKSLRVTRIHFMGLLVNCFVPVMVSIIYVLEVSVISVLESHTLLRHSPNSKFEK